MEGDERCGAFSRGRRREKISPPGGFPARRAVKTAACRGSLLGELQEDLLLTHDIHMVLRLEYVLRVGQGIHFSSGADGQDVHSVAAAEIVLPQAQNRRIALRTLPS